MHEHQNELEKLQKAALLIEEMSMGRLKVCPSTVGHVYIRPESDAYIGLQMQIAPESTPGRYAVTFTAFPRRMGLELGSSGLRRLMTEVNQSYALLTALEMQKYRPTQLELEQFREWRNAMKKLNKKAILTITGIALPLGAAAILIPRLRKRRRCKRTSA